MPTYTFINTKNNKEHTEMMSISEMEEYLSKNKHIKQAIIDPKNPGTVGTSAWNLGNHTLAICFILCIVFVVYASYQ